MGIAIGEDDKTVKMAIIMANRNSLLMANEI